MMLFAHICIYIFFPVARQPLGGLGRPIFRGFTITLFRFTTVGRTPLDEGPARRRDLYLTTHNTHKSICIYIYIYAYIVVKKVARTKKSGSDESLQLLFPDHFDAVSV
jgi:hypothetical protein